MKTSNKQTNAEAIHVDDYGFVVLRTAIIYNI